MTTDHFSEAERALAMAERNFSYGSDAQANAIAGAQVHATLALAQQLQYQNVMRGDR